MGSSGDRFSSICHMVSKKRGPASRRRDLSFVVVVVVVCEGLQESRRVGLPLTPSLPFPPPNSKKV